MDDTLNSGSIDHNVLYYQSFHRSLNVWNDRTVDELSCIRREVVVQGNISLHCNILSLLQALGFYVVVRLTHNYCTH